MTVRELAERTGPSASRRAAIAANTKPGPKARCKPELVLAIAAEIEQGASIEAACGAVGIAKSTLGTWRRKADEGVEPYVAILTPLKRALHVAVLTAARQVYAGRTGWQASARWLESMKPDPWRRTEGRELAGAEGKPIEVDIHLGEKLMREAIEAGKLPGVPGLTPQGLPEGCDCGAR